MKACLSCSYFKRAGKELAFHVTKDRGSGAFGWWAAAAVLPGLGLFAGGAGLGLVETLHALREEEARDKCDGFTGLLGFGPGPKF
jgi:hypothetical protein